MGQLLGLGTHWRGLSLRFNGADTRRTTKEPQMTALFVALERDIADFDPYVNGHALSDAERELEHIAKEIDVTPLMAFFSQNPENAADFIEDVGGDAEELDVPDEAWFDATEGLNTVDALLEHLAASPDALQNTDGVAAELKEWQAVLKRAATEGVRWHLEVDF
jgi:hypothetical protein